MFGKGLISKHTFSLYAAANGFKEHLINNGIINLTKAATSLNPRDAVLMICNHF